MPYLRTTGMYDMKGQPLAQARHPVSREQGTDTSAARPELQADRIVRAGHGQTQRRTVAYAPTCKRASRIHRREIGRDVRYRAGDILPTTTYEGRLLMLNMNKRASQGLETRVLCSKADRCGRQPNLNQLSERFTSANRTRAETHTREAA